MNKKVTHSVVWNDAGERAMQYPPFCSQGFGSSDDNVAGHLDIDHQGDIWLSMSVGGILPMGHQREYRVILDKEALLEAFVKTLAADELETFVIDPIKINPGDPFPGLTIEKP